MYNNNCNIKKIKIKFISFSSGILCLFYKRVYTIFQNNWKQITRTYQFVIQILQALKNKSSWGLLKALINFKLKISQITIIPKEIEISTLHNNKFETSMKQNVLLD